jgi:hypothetical protein
MISSARASTAGGIVRPMALAVRRLITNSNFVGQRHDEDPEGQGEPGGAP